MYAHDSPIYLLGVVDVIGICLVYNKVDQRINMQLFMLKQLFVCVIFCSCKK